MVAAITASKLLNFSAHGIDTIGFVAGGLPHLSLPPVNWHDMQLLIGIAGSCFVMILAQSAATARVYAERHQQHLNENADIVGLSAANLAAAISGTFVVNGSPTQTSMVESSGGRSQFAQICTAGVVAVVLLAFTGPVQYLPRCVLGSIVFIIAIKLVNLRGKPGGQISADEVAGLDPEVIVAAWCGAAIGCRLRKSCASADGHRQRQHAMPTCIASPTTFEFTGDNIDCRIEGAGGRNSPRNAWRQ